MKIPVFVSMLRAVSEADPRRKHFCHVLGLIGPAITSEALLPLDGWTQGSLQVGCGGCGQTGVGVGRTDQCAPFI
jgi:hypothetical protein